MVAEYVLTDQDGNVWCRDQCVDVAESKVMSQVSLPRIEMFPLIPLTRMLDLDMCLLASSGKWEMGMMQVVHPESNMPTPENVMPLLRRLIWTRGDRRSGRIWTLNVWWCWMDTWTWERVITSRSVPNRKSSSSKRVACSWLCWSLSVPGKPVSVVAMCAWAWGGWKYWHLLPLKHARPRKRFLHIACWLGWPRFFVTGCASCWRRGRFDFSSQQWMGLPQLLVQIQQL